MESLTSQLSDARSGAGGSDAAAAQLETEVQAQSVQIVDLKETLSIMAQEKDELSADFEAAKIALAEHREGVPPLSPRANAKSTTAKKSDDGVEQSEEDSSSGEEDSDDEERWPAGMMISVDTEDGIERATILGTAMNDEDDERHIRFADGTVDDWPVSDFRRLKHEGNPGVSSSSSEEEEGEEETGPPAMVHPHREFHCKQERDKTEKKTTSTFGKRQTLIDGLSSGATSIDRPVKIIITGSSITVKEDKFGFLAKELHKTSFENLVSWKLRPKRKDVLEVKSYDSLGLGGSLSSMHSYILKNASELKVRCQLDHAAEECQRAGSLLHSEECQRVELDHAA